MNTNTKNRLLKAKTDMGSWMFALMSQLSRDEFLHLVRTMDTDSTLSTFKTRLENARTLFEFIQENSNDKQAPYIGKPFFYNIKFQESQGVANLILELDTFHS